MPPWNRRMPNSTTSCPDATTACIARMGKLHHEETIRRDGQVIARVHFPMKYLIGSGHFRPHLRVRTDGFLFESPITWYSTKGKWGMSPGSTRFISREFRAAAFGVVCVLPCGRVEARDGAAHRLELSELAIGCESCHGPGSVHAARHQTKTAATGHGSQHRESG